jgi:4-hydroxymandelate oxidase
MTPAQQAPMPATLADHQDLARQHLPPAVWAYLAGGAGDEHTLRANEQHWADIGLRPRVLRDTRPVSLRTRLLGRDAPTPLLVAPMAQQRLVHPDGEVATALAASALGVGMVLSTQTHTPLSRIASLVLPSADRGPLWFQLYHFGDRAETLDLIQQAHAAGYEALVLTVDAPIQGVRDRERRFAGETLPSWPCPHVPRAARGPSPAQPLEQAATWDDVRWLREVSPLPLLLKGITHPEDAHLACELGVDGLIVSNHGGRVLDTLPATADLLPEVAAAVAGRCAVLVDGGLRRGTDVFKALALGADAVLLGRPVLWGLANAGATGVAHVLRLLLDELWATMVLCGTPTLAHIGTAHLHKNHLDKSYIENNSHL